MKNNILEYIILYVMVACAALVIATLARIFVASMGFDGFTTFMVFTIVLAVLVAVYLSIHVVLQNLMLPWIERLLMKIPYFKNKKKNLPPANEVPETITKQSILPSLEDIRKEQLQNKAKEQEESLNIALEYTRKTFAPYVSDKDIEILLGNVQAYANKLSLENLRPIKISKELQTLDLRHFGWNIWNFFKPRNQMDVAHFLKKVFPDVFKEVEVETIKRHLKDDERKGIIKIQETLSE